MKTDHTPEEWKLGIKRRNGDITVVTKWHVIAVVKAQKNTEANAALIAAAPDLLALVEAIEWLEHTPWGESFTIHGCPWCHEAQWDGHADDCKRQAAIAKARGEVKDED